MIVRNNEGPLYGAKISFVFLISDGKGISTMWAAVAQW